ncbi:hypothetical protein F5Y13DRAFT_43132 [Hypoxylon sp. FL1857]|nr:hypothetical protein F5Y13DRAFT_43132 [Hypoxylon sp. FL1857]
MSSRPESSRHRGLERPTSNDHGNILVVFVHGFEREDYRESLKKWVDEESRDLVEKVVPYTFSAENILRENRAGLKATAEDLRRMVSGLLNPLQTSTGVPLQQHAMTKVSHPSIIWIAHGLGTWVVKNALIDDALTEAVFLNLTAGVIFLDSLDPAKDVNLLTYSNLLKQILRKRPYRINFRKGESQEISFLAEDLTFIDRMYLTLCDGLSVGQDSKRRGWSERQEAYILVGWPNLFSNMPKGKRKPAPTGKQPKGELARLRVSLSRISRLIQERKALALDEQKYTGDVPGLRDLLSQVDLRNRVFNIAARVDDKHLAKLGDMNVTNPLPEGGHLHSSTRMDSIVTRFYDNRHSRLSDDVSQKLLEGLAELSSELFSVTHLEHYTEVMRGFLERESQELAKIKREAEDLHILNEGKQIPTNMAYEYLESTEDFDGVNSRIERAIGSIESMIEQLKKRLFLESLDLDESLGHYRELEIKCYRDHLATAVVEMIHGNYRQALEALESAESGYTLYLMPEHIIRLELSSFRALQLALNSKPLEAEQLCRTTITMMVEEQGFEHPMTLVTMSNLVHILLELSYFTSALETAAPLITKATKALGDQDPLTLRCKAQWALAKFYSGDYSGAEEILESIVRISEKCLGKDHPDMLLYQCFLAKVHLKRGKLEIAKRWVSKALETKRETWSKNTDENFRASKPITSRVHDTIDGPEASKNKVDDFLNSFVQDSAADPLGRKLPPQLLELLKLHTEIMFQESTKDSGVSIYKAIWMQERAQLGAAQLSTARSLYRLSIMTRETRDGHEICMEVEKQLKEVYDIRESILGRFHVDTLSARREILKTGCDLKSSQSSSISNDTGGGEEDSITWEHIYTESEYIYETHMSHLGRYHPETLESLLWLFQLRLSKTLDQRTEANSNELLLALRLLSDQASRLIESLDIQFSVALIYCGFGYYRIAEEILGQVLQKIKTAKVENDDGIYDSLVTIEVEVHDLLDHLQD